MWYHDGTKARSKATVRNLYAAVVTNEDDEDDENHVFTTAVTADDPALGAGTGFVPLLDKDGDPIYDDLGKIDFDHETTDPVTALAELPDDVPDNFRTDDGEKTCTTTDGGKAASKDGGVKQGDSTLCDAEDVEIPFKIVFTDDFGGKDSTHACPVTKEYTMTCQWDASGETDLGRGDTPPDSLTAANAAHFITCEIEEN